jgi:hypothetical protein
LCPFLFPFYFPSVGCCLRFPRPCLPCLPSCFLSCFLLLDAVRLPEASSPLSSLVSPFASVVSSLSFFSLFLLDAVSAFQRPCFPSCFAFLPSCRPSCFPLLDAVSAFPRPSFLSLFSCLPSLFPVCAIKLSVPFHVSEHALQQHYLYSTNVWGLRWCNFSFFPDVERMFFHHR